MYTTTEEAMSFALGAIDRGEAREAGEALTWILKREPKNELAWLWMPACLSDEERKRECYRKLSLLQIAEPNGRRE
jgi:hypothetical protein